MKTALELLGETIWDMHVKGHTDVKFMLEIVAMRAREEMRAEAASLVDKMTLAWPDVVEAILSLPVTP